MPKKNEEIQINPGDSVIINLPKNQPGKTLCCSVRVLNKKPIDEKNFVGQIIEIVAIDSQTSEYSPGKIMEFPKNRVTSVNCCRLNGVESTITIEICDGMISALWRTDGESAPINVRILDKDCVSDRVFKVDAVSAPLLTQGENNSEMEELFLLEE